MFFIDKLIGRIRKLDNEDLEDAETVVAQLNQGKLEFNLPVDFLHFVALCGIFPPSRNIVKHWKKSEDVFLMLVKKEGKIGIDHFMQSLVLYFIRVYKEELQKYAPTFMKKLVDENILKDKFIIDWSDKNIRLDKESLLYDKKAEKQFRDMIEQFVEWLK